MRIKYPQASQESEEELTRREQGLRGQKTADRVRMLRLLKSGAVKRLKECAPLGGYSVRQLTRWGERYRAEGLTEGLKERKPAGKPSRLPAEAWAGLVQAMRAGQIGSMQDGRNYLEREWGISYKNGKSLCWLFKKERVKWKSGGRRHHKASAQQQLAVKKTSGT